MSQSIISIDQGPSVLSSPQGDISAMLTSITAVSATVGALCIKTIPDYVHRSLNHIVDSRPLLSICEFGAVGDGSTDAAPAILATLAACASFTTGNRASFPVVYIPSGLYLIGSNITASGTFHVVGEPTSGLPALDGESITRSNLIFVNQAAGKACIDINGRLHLTNVGLQSGSNISTSIFLYASIALTLRGVDVNATDSVFYPYLVKSDLLRAYESLFSADKFTCALYGTKTVEADNCFFRNGHWVTSAINANATITNSRNKVNQGWLFANEGTKTGNITIKGNSYNYTNTTTSMVALNGDISGFRIDENYFNRGGANSAASFVTIRGYSSSFPARAGSIARNFFSLGTSCSLDIDQARMLHITGNVVNTAHWGQPAFKFGSSTSGFKVVDNFFVGNNSTTSAIFLGSGSYCHIITNNMSIQYTGSAPIVTGTAGPGTVVENNHVVVL